MTKEIKEGKDSVLLQLRKENGWTQATVAHILKINIKTYRGYEKEPRKTPANILFALSQRKCFDTSMEELLFGKGYTALDEKVMRKTKELSQEDKLLLIEFIDLMFSRKKFKH